MITLGPSCRARPMPREWADADPPPPASPEEWAPGGQSLDQNTSRAGPSPPTPPEPGGPPTPTGATPDSTGLPQGARPGRGTDLARGCCKNATRSIYCGSCTAVTARTRCPNRDFLLSYFFCFTGFVGARRGWVWRNILKFSGGATAIQCWDVGPDAPERAWHAVCHGTRRPRRRLYPTSVSASPPRSTRFRPA